jgi:hypothetical protein
MRNLSVKFLACLLIWQSEVVYACPMCKDILKAFSGLTEGYFWSILLMISVPFLIVGLFAGMITREYRRSRMT